MASTEVQGIEDRLKNHVFAMRVRLHDLFSDFDKLRSGFVTVSQFRRCIAAATQKGSLSPPLTEDEFKLLVQEYSAPSKAGIQWTRFVQSIDTVFATAHNIDKGATRAQAPRSPIVVELLARLRSYVKHHGSDVKSWFRDFDQHNTGYITRSQFRRGFPVNLLDEEEEERLLECYAEENSVNYLKMNTDVNRKQRARNNADSGPGCAPYGSMNAFIPVGTEDLLRCNVRAAVPEVDGDRVRLVEFFKDYDRHNCGVVSRNQFCAAVKLATPQLLYNEITLLAESYKYLDDRVSYRQFCKDMDQVFTVSNLESQPLANVAPPPREYLVHLGTTLPAEEEARIEKVLNRFRNKIAERRPLLAPYFKDFDRNHLGNMGKVTKSHFARLLSSVKLEVSEPDLFLLFKKYQDGGRINYMRFINDVDPLGAYFLYSIVAQISRDSTQKAIQPETPPKDFDAILKQLRYEVQTRRIRVREFFKDFDKLRSYTVKKEEFVRGVMRIGVSLSERELEIVASHYAHPQKTDVARWKDFESDIELVFGQTNLETRPEFVSKPLIVQSTPFVLNENVLDATEELILENCIKGMKQHLKIRQSSIKPIFKDFDKLCSPRGYVTASEFRQCLTYAQCDVTDEEFSVLCKKWGKAGSNGLICYLLFLQALETNESAYLASEIPEYIYDYRKYIKNEGPTLLSTQETEKLMNRIKTKVKTQRVRVLDFMRDFDLLKHAKITANEFRRGLAVVIGNLSEAELKTLETIYQSPSEPGMVDYVRFNDEVESVFTIKGLEKLPTTNPPEFKNYVYESGATPLNAIVQTADTELVQVLSRLSEKIHQRRLDLLSYLEDFDFVNEGTISTNQFRSALGTVGLVVGDSEIIAISKRYGTTRNKDRINYRAFANSLALHTSLDNIGTRANRVKVYSHSLW